MLPDQQSICSAMAFNKPVDKWSDPESKVVKMRFRNGKDMGTLSFSCIAGHVCGCAFGPYGSGILRFVPSA